VHSKQPGPAAAAAPDGRGELGALTQPELSSLLVRSGIKSGGFGDFSPL